MKLKVKDFFYQFKKNELKKNIFLLVSGNGVAQLVPLLIYPIITRLYSPESFGAFAFIFSIHSILITIATGRYDSAIILPRETDYASKLFSIGLTLSIVLSLIIPAFTFFANFYLPNNSNFHNQIIWIYLLSFTVFFNAVALLFNGWCNRYKLFKIIIGYSLIFNLSSTGIRVILGILDFESGLLLSFIISQGISTIYFIVALKTIDKNPTINIFDRKLLPTAKKYINFLKYNMPRTLLNTFSGNLPIFLLTTFFSNRATGYFSIALTLLFRPIFIYNSSVSQVLMQRVIELKNNNERIWPFIKKYIITTFSFSIVPSILLIIIAPNIIPFILGKEYKEAGILCSIMVPWAFTAFTGGSIAFIPTIFFKQLQELIIDIIYIILRVAALSIGIYFNNVLLGIGLFSLCGVIVIGYQIIWYRRLLKMYDNELITQK